MKVAYFLGALNRGGAETLILDICRQHAHVPYDFVCVYRHDGNMSDEFKSSGAPMVHIPKNGGLWRYILQVRNVLLRENVTVVHSQTPSNTIILAFALIGTGIRIITTFHGHTFAPAPWWKRKVVYAASKKILCVSKYEKSYYEQKWHLPPENKLQVVYNGIDFGKFDAAKPLVENEKWTVSSGKIRLCMVGNFVRGRSQHVVVRALKLVDDSEEWRDKVDFYFIGRRDEKQPHRYDDCVCYCAENQLQNVHFMGSRNDVPSILRTMDGFVYSTEHDTFGIAVIEAIASGLPVVVNDWPVMTEVCDSNLSDASGAIRFFQTENIVDCARQIIEMLDDIKNNQRELSQDCLKAAVAVKHKYSIQSHIKQLTEVYQSL